MTKKTEWQIEREENEAIRKKAMKDLTIDQVRAIKETHEALKNALSMLSECNDLYISDVRQLDAAFWALQNQFNLEQ